MQPDELSIAVKNVVDVLNKSDLLSAVRQYRASKSDDIAVASARLGHAGAVLMEGMESFSENDKQIARCLHLEGMASPGYWQALLMSADGNKKKSAELVQLYSRVMFANSHLPNLIKLLGSVDARAAARTSDTTGAAPVAAPLSAIEGGLTIQLTDAGERAADPDRIARSIDGIDMLYSACASIARKPAMDLALVRIDGSSNRNLHFLGEKDSISAVWAVIQSIPDALNEIDPEGDIDLNQVVSTLPIFQDLATLAQLGTFSESDLNDIRETMHQGALLALESGVILVKPDAKPSVAPSNDGGVISLGGPTATAATGNGIERDEHYENYLKEREAMQRNGAAPDDAGASSGMNEQEKREAVDELLKNLGRTRGDA
ncbi:MAG: hypothetical protein V3U65_08275 [Granulosicoccaceae bacterium]